MYFHWILQKPWSTGLGNVKTNKWTNNMSTATGYLRSTVTRVLTIWHFPWCCHVVWGRPQPGGQKLDLVGETELTKVTTQTHVVRSTKYWNVKPHANDSLLICRNCRWMGYSYWPDQWIISLPERPTYSPEVTQWAWTWQKKRAR